MEFSHFEMRLGGSMRYHRIIKKLVKSKKLMEDEVEFAGSEADDFVYMRSNQGTVDGGEGEDALVLRGSQDDYQFQTEGDGIRVTNTADPEFSLLLHDFESVIFVPAGRIRKKLLKHLAPIVITTLVTTGDGGAAVEENLAPVAEDDGGFTLIAGETIEIPTSALLANDGDGDGDALSITDVGSSVNGSVVLDGDSIRFTALESGEASFSYTLSDGEASDTANVSLAADAAGPVFDENFVLPDEALEAPDSALGLANPSVAGGLDGNSYYSSALPFINIFKSAGGWSVRLDDGSVLKFEDLQAGGYLDENGYIKEMPAGATNVEVVVHVPTASDGYVPAGRYVISYDGDADLDPWLASGTIVSEEPGRIVFDYTGPKPFIINMGTVDNGESGNYLNNVSIVREELVDLYEAGAIFEPGFIDMVDDHRVIRFMDLQATNWSSQVNFEDINSVDYFSWASGGGGKSGTPISVMVDLANQIGADPWFNIPHQATDDYIRQFAEYVRDNLDPGLTAYFEYSNEAWNFIFSQASWTNETGLEFFTDVPEFRNDDYPFSEYYGYRSAEMMSIVQDVFGDGFEARTHGVLATQTRNTGVLYPALAGAEYFATNSGHTIDELFDSVAVTGYFDAGIGREATLPLIQQWIDESKARYEAGLEDTPYQYFNEQAAINLRDQSLQQQAVNDGLITSMDGTSIQDLATIHFPENFALAEQYGLDLIQYEAGSHVTAQGALSGDEEVFDFIVHLNDSPEMAQITLEMITAFRAAGGTLVNDFVLIGSHKKSGSWGSLEYAGDDSPIWDAWASYNEATPGDWEERDPDAFLHGDLFQGTDGNDVLLGTTKQDFLLGGSGDDVLRGGTGDDGYNGGAGSDVVVLEGSASDYTISTQGDGYIVEGQDGLDYMINVEALYFTASNAFYDLG
jgi:Ca2+-binding RTX toxin-like protein